MSVRTKFSSTDLGVLQRQLAEWRQSQSGRSRLPAEVWDAAAVLADRHRPSAVARTLGLSYSKLRQWMNRALPASTATPERTGFVELKWCPPPDAGVLPEPVGWAELRDSSGRRLRLHTGYNPECWLALSEAFWRACR